MSDAHNIGLQRLKSDR